LHSEYESRLVFHVFRYRHRDRDDILCLIEAYLLSDDID
jgi:hypothetical protein